MSRLDRLRPPSDASHGDRVQSSGVTDDVAGHRVSVPRPRARPRPRPRPRKPTEGHDDVVDVAVLIDLVAAACAAGASLTAALLAVGDALGGPRGRALTRAGAALGLGADWSTAWAEAGDLATLASALRPSWERGVAPGPALRAAADAVRRERHSHALDAAGRLGTRLVLPLGLCYLPAFVLVGLAPVLVSMASGALAG